MLPTLPRVQSHWSDRRHLVSGNSHHRHRVAAQRHKLHLVSFAILMYQDYPLYSETEGAVATLGTTNDSCIESAAYLLDCCVLPAPAQCATFTGQHTVVGKGNG